MEWLFELERIRGSGFEGGEFGVEAASSRITSAETLGSVSLSIRTVVNYSSSPALANVWGH
jgi:hypothetical protein